MNISYFNRHESDGYSIEKITKHIVSEVSKANDVKNLQVPFQRVSVLNLLKNIIYVYKHREKNGVNHITGDVHYAVLGLIDCRSILTIHDLVFLEGKQSKLSYWFKYFFWLYMPVKMADRIVCISEKTKQEVLKHINTDKIAVIYDPVKLVEIDVSRKSFNETCPRILHVGTKANKNLNRVIRSLNGVKCHLVIVGKLTKEIINFLKENNIEYENLVGISDVELANEYTKADIVSFVSTFEGFGMPIIEGQIADCIVITSNIAPMTEVGENSVIYVDPFSVDSIRSGFLQIISDKTLRESIIMKGRENRKRFSPEIIAAQYSNLYHSLLHQ